MNLLQPAQRLIKRFLSIQENMNDLFFLFEPYEILLVPFPNFIIYLDILLPILTEKGHFPTNSNPAVYVFGYGNQKPEEFPEKELCQSLATNTLTDLTISGITIALLKAEPFCLVILKKKKCFFLKD